MRFAEKENIVLGKSHPYNISSAFRKAMSYIARTNEDFYKELIELEFNEGFGDQYDDDDEEDEEDYEDEDDEDE